MIEESIREHALAVPILANMIGTRWYGPVMPQLAEFPCVTVSRVSGEQIMSHDGFSGLERARYQIDVRADCQLKVRQICSYIEKAFRPPVGGQIGGPNYRLNCSYIERVGVRDMGQDPVLNIAWRSLDFMFLYEVQP